MGEGEIEMTEDKTATQAKTSAIRLWKVEPTTAEETVVLKGNSDQ
jgi:hypothetical protein